MGSLSLWQKTSRGKSGGGNEETDLSSRFQLSVSSLPPKTDSCLNTKVAQTVAANELFQHSVLTGSSEKIVQVKKK